MAAKDFEVQEDVWIGNAEMKPVDPQSAEAGAFRLKAGTKITSERAREIGLLKGKPEEEAAAEPEVKAEESAPENKARRRAPAKKSK
jgi:hypothetical protein